MINKKCKCCGKVIKNKMANAQFCNNCALYLIDLKRQLIYYKSEVRKLKLRLYNFSDGRERVRNNSQQSKTSKNKLTAEMHKSGGNIQAGGSPAFMLKLKNSEGVFRS